MWGKGVWLHVERIKNGGEDCVLKGYRSAESWQRVTGEMGAAWDAQGSQFNHIERQSAV